MGFESRWERKTGIMALESSYKCFNKVFTEFKQPFGYEELPEWLRSNEYVRHGYRHQIKSVVACFKTIFSRHNETGNIWTHLIGTLMFSVYLVGFAYQYLGIIPFLDYLAIMFFFVGAILCFFLSTLYHTLMCHSEALVNAFARLDYIGINILITCSHIPWIYYSFYCRKRIRNTYVATLLLSSVLIALCSLYDRFGEADSRGFRSGIFGCFAVFSIIPAIHLVYLDGLQLAYNQAALGWLMLMFSVYFVGATLYTSRFPERYRPGYFDIFFQSHQLMHVCTVLGSYLHMHVIHKLMSYRMETGPCIVD
ncbi:progestin and adipoQ receptor-like protein 1 isoform X2 [Cimex lectularius]|uniref:Adiponectin receptor n=1 Tax=Cimex lectularius TaxID=79782 RepID=A0A8I6SR70_CIMLE|nr:progestin and adipoQ receptor-like protein 1 isoform X2 [Cimex lectularius]